MAITTYFLTGFEHGFVGAGMTAGLGCLANVLTGTAFAAGSASPRNGSRYAHLVSPANTAEELQFNTSASLRNIVRFGVKVSTRPSSGDAVIALSSEGPPTTTPFKLTVSSTGALKMGSAAGTIQTGPTIDTTNWHLIEIQADTSANPWTINWKVDGVLQTQAVSDSRAAATLNTVSLGNSNAVSAVGTQATFTVDYDDLIIGAWTAGGAATDWYGDGKVLAQLPGSDGTHATVTSLAPGDSATAYSGTVTTAWTQVSDAPGTGGWTATRTTTGNLALRTGTVGAYLEIAPATTAQSGQANAVRAIISYSSSTTVGNLAGCDIRNSGGAVTVLRGTTGGTGASYAVTANNFAPSVGVLVTRPAAGWTAAEVNALRFRFGGCTSAIVNPVPTVQAMMLEVDWPVAAPVVLLLAGQHHRRPQGVAPRRDAAVSRGRF